MQPDNLNHERSQKLIGQIKMTLFTMLVLFTGVFNFILPSLLGFAELKDGRRSVLMILVFSLIVVGVIGLSSSRLGQMIPLFISLLFFAAIGIYFVVSIKNGRSPFKTLGISFGAISLCAVIGYFSLELSEKDLGKNTVHSLITAKLVAIDKLIQEGSEGQVLTEKKKEIVYTDEQLLSSIRSVFMNLMFVLWINLFVLLKISHRFNPACELTEKTLLNFKAPFALTYVLVIALAMATGGELISTEISLFGSEIVKLLAVIYFFAGIGIYLEFLTRYGVTGFLRSILIVVTVVFCFPFVVIAGVLDVFWDIRKFLRKKTSDPRDQK